jgi:hypothetical protein
VRARLGGLGFEIAPPEQQTPKPLARAQRAEIEKWWLLINAADIGAE